MGKIFVFSRGGSNQNNYRFSVGNGGSNFGTTWYPVFTGRTIDNAPSIYFFGDHRGTSTGGRGIVVFDGRMGDLPASDSQVVIEFCSGYGKRLASIDGSGSFWLKSGLKASGSIGIGKDCADDFKLDVAGKIRAEEILIEAETADFVFEEDYQLRDLNEVEAHIKEFKHLPDVPSAAQMEKDGVNIAEMNKLLLQKIEELTLYVIEQQKEIELLKSKN